ncbi:ABC transporter ATP-binding protein [Ruminococcus sp. CLA-AA-H200]|uniref:ABC transporter ATP-binding protein n=1 Tax=Ruminococcus turbiniformis TaxID=2881258 RepID=A0ABS8FT36_9FIRM|nr:ABC transporter ATP-binding protein [Ruminococcus turbiniformis]MCC2253142.1 ABC transporter ATP-binding protein [Ruminococcus turbiniformis]
MTEYTADQITASVEGIKKYYGKGPNLVKALDGVSLKIERGKFTMIIGTSGSGKTTFLNLLGGQDRPTEGKIFVDGTRIDTLREPELAVYRRNKVGFIYQNFNLIPMLTVRENILFSQDMGNLKPDPGFFDEITETLGLKDRLDACPGELSGGGQQKAAIARALIGRPSLVLADEPTGNLDTKSSQNVLALLRLMNERYHQTIVMITHNLEIAQMADRVLRMEDGKIVSGEAL